MIYKGIFLDTCFKNLRKKLTWWQAFLREKRNGILAEALTCGGPGAAAAAPAPRPSRRASRGPGGRGPSRPLLFRGQRSCCFHAPKQPHTGFGHRSTPAAMPACLGAAEPAVTRADHPQVSNSERPGSPQFAQLVLLGAPHWDGAAAGAHSCKAGAHSQRCLQRLHPGVARLRLGFVPPVPGEWDVAILPFLRLRLGFVPPVPGEWDMPILPFLLQTPRRCLKCLWALAAEGRHGGTFRSPRRWQWLGAHDTYLNKNRSEKWGTLLTGPLWKARMTSPTRKPTGLGLVILKNAITECLCNAW